MARTPEFSLTRSHIQSLIRELKYDKPQREAKKKKYTVQWHVELSVQSTVEYF